MSVQLLFYLFYLYYLSLFYFIIIYVFLIFEILWNFLIKNRVINSYCCCVKFCLDKTGKHTITWLAISFQLPVLIIWKVGALFYLQLDMGLICRSSLLTSINLVSHQISKKICTEMSLVLLFRVMWGIIWKMGNLLFSPLLGSQK